MIDWAGVKKEATELLGRYIQINTVNPPGNERPAAEFLAGVLAREGVETRLLGASQERPALLARLEGDGSGGGAVMLLHHTDTVGVEAEKWTMDPFGGQISQGRIYGRGALDMKGMGVLELLAFLLIKRAGLGLTRDIIYLAVPDEEAGGQAGAEWIVKNHPELVDADYVLNEGGIGSRHEGDPVFNIGIGEKGPLWLRLTARGGSGHGSIPLADNACFRLARACARLADHRPPTIIVPELASFLELAGLGRDIKPAALAGHELLKDPSVHAMFHNTISLTVLEAGSKINVIPSQASASLDCRLLPHQKAGEFIAELKRVLDDDNVSVEVLQEFPASVSPPDTPMYQALGRALAACYGNVPIIPSICPGFTDSRCFRELGAQAYGLIPLIVEGGSMAGMHGHDEHLPLADLGRGVRVIYQTLLELCAR